MAKTKIETAKTKKTMKKTETKVSKISSTPSKDPIKLSKDNFSKCKNWFYCDDKLVKITDIKFLEIRHFPLNEKGEKTQEYDYAVLLINGLQNVPCWFFDTEEQAKHFVKDFWANIK